MSLVTFISFVIVISAGFIEYVKFYVTTKIFFNGFQPGCLYFSSFLFVVLSASCNDILAGVSDGSLMR